MCHPKRPNFINKLLTNGYQQQGLCYDYGVETQNFIVFHRPFIV